MEELLWKKALDPQLIILKAKEKASHTETYSKPRYHNIRFHVCNGKLFGLV